MFIYKNIIKLKTYSKAILYMFALVFAISCNNKSSDTNNKLDAEQDKAIEVKNRIAGKSLLDSTYHEGYAARERASGNEYSEHVKELFERTLKDFMRGMNRIEKQQRIDPRIHRFPFLLKSENAFSEVGLPDVVEHIHHKVRHGERAIDHIKHHRITEKKINNLKDHATNIHNHPFRTLRCSEKALEHQARRIDSIHPRERKEVEKKLFAAFRKHMEEHVKWQEKILHLNKKNPNISGAYIYSLLDPHQSMEQNHRKKIGIEAHHYNAPLTKKFGHKLKRILIHHGNPRQSKLNKRQILVVNRLTAKMDRLTKKILNEIRDFKHHLRKRKDRIKNFERNQHIRDEERTIKRQVEYGITKHKKGRAREKMEREINRIDQKISRILNRAEVEAKTIRHTSHAVKLKIKKLKKLRKDKLHQAHRLIQDAKRDVRNDVAHSYHKSIILHEMNEKIKNDIRKKHIKKFDEDIKRYISELENKHKYRHHKHPILNQLGEDLGLIKHKHKKALEHIHNKHKRKLQELEHEHRKQIQHIKHGQRRNQIHRNIHKRLQNHHNESLENMVNNQQKQINNLQKELKKALSRIDDIEHEHEKRPLKEQANEMYKDHEDEIKSMTDEHKHKLETTLQDHQSKIDYNHHKRNEEEEDNQVQEVDNFDNKDSSEESKDSNDEDSNDELDASDLESSDFDI